MEEERLTQEIPTETVLEDKILICVECNEEFVFTVGAQEYFLERGITEDPKRCKFCYMALKKGKRQEKKSTHRNNSNGRNHNSNNYNYNQSRYNKKY